MKTSDRNQTIHKQSLMIPKHEQKTLIYRIINRAKIIIKKIKIKLALIIMIGWVSSSSHSSAQNFSMEEVVYLKNGSVIRGVIIEQIPNKSIKIQTRDNNLLVFEISAVEKITKEASYPKINYSESQESAIVKLNERSENKISYELITEAGFLSGFGEISTKEQIFTGSYQYDALTIINEDHGFSLRTVHAIKINHHLMMGGGIGFDFLESLILMPITLDTRILLGKNKIQPYFNIALGQAVPINGETGGFLFNAGFGIKSRSGWAFNLALRTQKTDWGFIHQSQLYKINGTGKFLSISSGYFF